jgi:protein-S-isoprenylcysteine O-methyltransferase Ste14
MADQDSDHPNVIALPPLIYLGALGLGLIGGYLWPATMAWGTARLAAGVILVAAGVAFGGAAVRRFVRAGTNLEVYKPATALVTDGPYQISRNPMYLTLSLVVAGIGLLANNAWILVVLIPTLAVMHVGVIVREERYLEAKFGDEYRRYKSRVRRWL